MFKNKILYLLLCIHFLGHSQAKKVTDTIYIYEEVIVHDTIYIQKPLGKLRFEKVIISPAKKGIKPFLILINNAEKIIIPIDSIILKTKQKPFLNNWQFEAKIATRINSNSLFKEFNSNVQISYGLGAFIKKRVFHPNFSIGIGVEVAIVPSTLNINASNSDSFLNGFYFTDNGNPKLFEGLNNKGFQIQIPLQFYWKINKFTPSIGIFGNKASYEAIFLASSRTLPLKLDENQSFDAQIYSFGYLAQLEYALFKNWSFGVNYSYATARSINFKRNNESFAVDKKIKQNAFELSIFYVF